MSQEPQDKRAIAFFDGQNLYHAAREAFGHKYPRYDPKALASALCGARGWRLQQVRFYTGVPDASDDPFWNHFWTSKLAQMGREGVWTFSRSLRYQNKTVALPNGSEHTYLAGHEKGTDVRIALDVLSLALDNVYDVALIFSQDQDLSELAVEMRRIAMRERRWIKLVSAFPQSPTYRNRRGINGTDWIPMPRKIYESHLDARDYRVKAAE